MSDGHWERSATSALAVELDGIRWWLRMLAKAADIDGDADPDEIISTAIMLLRTREEMCEAQSEVIKGFEAARDGTVAGALEELGARAGESLEEAVERLRPRIMPEGMEWPHTEAEEPVKLGDQLIDDDELDEWREVDTIIFQRAEDGYTVEIENNRGVSQLYRPGERVKRPAPKVLDADGVEIREGETVYKVGGTGHAYRVVGIRVGDPFTPTVVTCDEGDGTGERLLPSQLTHTKPEIDTWERIEEDATLSPWAYADRRGIEVPGYRNDPDVADVVEPVLADVVRRAKKLAGVGE